MKKSLLSLVAACALMGFAGAAYASGHDEAYPAPPPPTVVPESTAPAEAVAPVAEVTPAPDAEAQAPDAQPGEPASFAAVAFAAWLVLALVNSLVLVGILAPVWIPKMRRAAHVASFRLVTHAYEWREYLRKRTYAGLYRMGAIAYVNFPATVTTDLAFGVIGEWFLDGPQRAQPARISHNVAADIVVGHWFTIAADGTARPGGAGAVGGVLMNAKNYASYGTSGGGPLAPTLTVPTGTIGEFGYMGEVVVTLATAVAIGDVAKYNTTTGVIGVGAPGGGEAAIPNAKFIRYANAAGGLAVLELTN